MAIGEATENVVVTAAPPVLDTDSATLGAVIENSAYSNLPLEAQATQERDPTAFALLVQGAMPGTDGRLPSLSGTPGHQASLYLDGVPSETLNQQGDNRTVALNVDVDSVDQFQVITSVPPAEYMGAGAENYTMKSGTLQFHGGVLDLIRNTAFDTFTFTQKQATVTNASAPIRLPRSPEPLPGARRISSILTNFQPGAADISLTPEGSCSSSLPTTSFTGAQAPPSTSRRSRLRWRSRATLLNSIKTPMHFPVAA